MKHIVGFSGGIDSQACARWVLNRYPAADVILMNSDAGGNEHPITTEFVDWYSANVHPVTNVNPIVADVWRTEGFAESKGLDGNKPLNFGDLIQIKGRAPSRKAQFCTEILKLRPQKRWMQEHFGPGGIYDGEEFVRYSGVRRDESDARRNACITEWDTFYDCELARPIADWTKQMCFDYVQSHGEQINELYTLGFTRVGCAPCINSSKSDIRNWALRFPAMIEKLRGWEKRSGRTFFPPIVPGLAMNNIEEVVAWSMTKWGGREQLSDAELERPSCESKYGLCA